MGADRKVGRLPSWMKTTVLRRAIPIVVTGLLLAQLIGAPSYTASAQPVLTIAPITWNVVGLDSNDVNAGPNNFPVGARVCNTGDATATNVASSFVWVSSDPYVNSRPGSLTSLSVASLAAGACTDFYYEIQVTRNTSAYDHVRRYHITFTSSNWSMRESMTCVVHFNARPTSSGATISKEPATFCSPAPRTSLRTKSML